MSGRAYTSTPRLSAARRNLLLGCASGAALAMAGGTAHAQSAGFQGTPTVVTGNVVINQGTTDTFTVNTPTARIDWTTFDNGVGGPAIDFLPADRGAIFQNGSGTTDFSVLNRIIPADTGRQVAINGSVVSRIQDFAAGTSAPGGTVAFYSPGGILIGATATIDVGSLLLTALDPVNFGSGPTMQLRGATDSTSQITIAAGAQISASPENSYVAVVAPSIVQNGNVRANGAIAYVAAESVDMTINGGLFDITVLSGTSVSSAISHLGSSGGAASTDVSDVHKIYAVAVPKNQAMSILLQGSMGFDTPTSATIENGEIVLSAGYDIVSGAIGTEAPGTGDASVGTVGGTYTSDFRGRARTNFFVQTDGANDSSFTGDVAIAAGSVASIQSAGGLLSILGDAVVDASDIRTGISSGLSAQAGQANVFSNGGDISIGGNLQILAVAGGADGLPGSPGAATGGSSNLTVVGSGTVDVGGNLTMAANAQAGQPFGSGPPATGQGGSVNVSITGGAGSIDVGGDVFATVVGRASGSGELVDPITGVGSGGTININASAAGSSIAFGSLTADAGGVGSAGPGDGAIDGGDGVGGLINLGADIGTLTVTGVTSLAAVGRGGNGALAGRGATGFGGNVQLFSNGGTLTFGDDVVMTADAIGGDGQGGGGALGGSAAIFGVGAISFQGDVDLSADATGGTTFAGGPGGGAAGGFAGVNASGSAGAISFTNLSISASASGGSGTLGGSGGAGAAEIDVTGGQITASGAVTLEANGTGGSGATSGGLGQGGTATAEVAGGSMTLASLTTRADGTGGNSQDSGEGRGGVAGFEVSEGTGTITGLLTASAVGTGGSDTFPTGGTGGDGYGGLVYAVASLGEDGYGNPTGGVGTLNVGSANLNASGQGGAGGAGNGSDIVAGAGGAGFGGVADSDGGPAGAYAGAAAEGAIATFGDVTLISAGVGGRGGNGGNAQSGGAGGAGTGGITQAGTVLADLATIGSSSASFGNLSLDSSATGGNIGSGLAQSLGGAATGGNASLSAVNGTITATGVGLNAGATSGSGGTGGNATGGLAIVNVDNAQLTVTNILSAEALANGGAGNSNGGAATGGRGIIGLNPGGGAIDAGTLVARASATGGGGTLGNGGAATGGRAEIYTNAGAITFVSATIESNAAGGDGFVGGTANAGTGPGDATGGGSFLDTFGGGTITGGSVLVSASAFGGDGSVGAGGIAVGGLTGVSAQNGAGTTFIALDEAVMLARAFGGAGGNGGATGTGGSGGNALGGSVFAAAQTLSGNLSIDDVTGDASAFGGAGGAATRGGSGGSADGGVLINIGSVSGNGTGTPTGGTIFGSVDLIANATGGAGGAGTSQGGLGGNGSAGQAGLLARGGTLDIGSASITVNGIGGAGGSGGAAGGVGSGGFVQALFTPRNSSTSTASVEIGSFTGLSIGTGGTGSTVGQSRFGQASISVVNSSVAIGDVQFTVIGDTPRVDDGSAVSASSINVNGGLLDIIDDDTLSISTDGALLFTVSNGGTLRTVNLVTSSVLDTTINVTGGTIDILQDAILDGADGVLLTAGEGGLFRVGGDMEITSVGGDTISGDIAFTAIGTGTFDVGGTLSAFTPEADGDESIVVNHLTSIDDDTQPAGRTTISAADILFDGGVDTDDSSIVADNTIIFTSSESMRVGDLTAGTSIVLASDAARDPSGEEPNIVFVGNVTAPTVAVSARSFGFDLAGQVNATNAFALTSADDLFLDTAVVGQNIILTAAGSITANDGVGISGTNISLIAGGALTLDDVMATQSASFVSGGRATFNGLVSAPQISVSSADIAINDGATLGAPEITQNLVLSVQPTASAVILGGDGEPAFTGYELTQAEAGRIEARNIQFLVLAALATRTMTFSGIGNSTVTLPSYTEDGITATSIGGTFWGFPDGQQLHFDPGSGFGNSTYDFTFQGGAFSLLGFDLSCCESIGALANLTAYGANGGIIRQGSFDVSGTDPLAFTDWTGITRLRIENVDNHFSLDNFTIGAGSGNGTVPTVTIRDLTIIGSQDGGVESLVVRSDGVVRVEGAVNYFDAASTDTLDIFAAERLEIVSGGSITMGAEDTVSGILNLGSNGSIIAASSDLAADLAENPNLANRNDLLGQSSGTGDVTGVIRANTVNLSADGSILIQNTGTATDQGAITVGSGGLTFNRPSGSGTLDVVAFGRRVNPDGSFTSGAAFFQTVNFNIGDRGITYTPASLFNGFAPGGGVVIPPPQEPEVPIAPTISDVVLGPVESIFESPATEAAEDDSGPGGFGAGFTAIVDTGSFTTEALIEEPVASGGDSSLWTDGEAPEDEDDDSEAPVATAPGNGGL